MMLCAESTESNVQTVWKQLNDGWTGENAKFSPVVLIVGTISIFFEITVDKQEILLYSIFCSEQSDVCASGSAVEHLLAKEGVAGSIPVSRSFIFIKCFDLDDMYMSAETVYSGFRFFMS